MLRVSKKQFARFTTTFALEMFEDEVVLHLEKFVPQLLKTLGEVGFRRCIQFGVERASGYGIRNPGLLRFYIELMFMYGSHFDTDPYIPWAGPILRNPEISDEASRMSLLYDAMLWYLDTIDGPGRAYATDALRNLHQIGLANFATKNLCASETATIDGLRKIYPRRCDYLGEPLMKQLVRTGIAEATRHGVATDRGITLTIGMVFALGHGFAADPILPWINTTLTDPTIKNADELVARLERRTQIYLNDIITHIDRNAAYDSNR